MVENRPAPARGAADSADFSVHAGGKPTDPMKAIIPVFRRDERGPITVLGTGFFISRLGIFVSAKHVFMDVLDGTEQPRAGLEVMQFGDNGTFYQRPVDSFVIHEGADVGVGMCHPMNHRTTGKPLFNMVVTLSRRRPQLGDEVWTYAYAGTQIEGDDAPQVIVDPKFYLGRIRQKFPTGRDSLMLPAPCYETSIVLRGGTSGGPVFSYGGRVVGVNSSGFDGDLDVSFISRIEDVFPLGFPNVQLPDESAPRRVTIDELATLRYVSIR
jgi:hypothetical protein